MDSMRTVIHVLLQGGADARARIRTEAKVESIMKAIRNRRQSNGTAVLSNTLQRNVKRRNKKGTRRTVRCRHFGLGHGSLLASSYDSDNNDDNKNQPFLLDPFASLFTLSHCPLPSTRHQSAPGVSIERLATADRKDDKDKANATRTMLELEASN